MLTHEQIIERVEQRFKCRTRSIKDPKPHKIDNKTYGNHASYVEDGWRIWGFVNENDRNKFVEDYSAEFV